MVGLLNLTLAWMSQHANYFDFSFSFFAVYRHGSIVAAFPLKTVPGVHRECWVSVCESEVELSTRSIFMRDSA